MTDLTHFFVTVPSNNLTSSHNVTSDFELVFPGACIAFSRSEEWGVGMTSILVPPIDPAYMGNHVCLVYCSVAERSFVGDVRSQLLGEVDVSEKSKKTNLLCQPEHVIYRRISFNNVQRVGIMLRDEQGRVIPFLKGAVVVNLHFRRMEGSEEEVRLMVVSNAFPKAHPDNTMNHFRATLDPTMTLDTDEWEVGMTQILMPGQVKQHRFPQEQALLFGERAGWSGPMTKFTRVSVPQIAHPDADKVVQSVAVATRNRPIVFNVKKSDHRTVRWRYQVYPSSSTVRNYSKDLPVGNYTTKELVIWLNTAMSPLAGCTIGSPSGSKQDNVCDVVTTSGIEVYLNKDSPLWWLLGFQASVENVWYGTENGLANGRIIRVAPTADKFPGRATTTSAGGFEVCGKFGLGVTKEVAILFGWHVEGGVDKVPKMTHNGEEFWYLKPPDFDANVVGRFQQPSLATVQKRWSHFWEGSTYRDQPIAKKPKFHDGLIAKASDGYANFAGQSWVGGARVGLLDIFPVGEVRALEFKHPRFTKPQFQRLEEIEIDIRDEQGKPFPFQPGVVAVNLQFRKNAKRKR